MILSLPKQHEVPEVVIVDSCEPHMFRSRFCGMAYTEDSIIVDDSGFQKYCALHGLPKSTDLEGGRFFAILFDGDIVRAFCDPMGQDTLYYYSANEIRLGSGTTEDWCISNSFISLVQHLQRTGRTLSLHAPALSSFFIANGRGYGAQLLSHRTTIREIQVLPIGWELIGTRVTGHLRLKKYLPLPGRGENREKHRDGVERYLRKAAGRIRALSSISSARIFCDLSGGRDSRIVTGLLMKCGISPDSIYINSNRQANHDYAIAEKVASFLGFKLIDSTALLATRRDKTAFAHWAKASSCCYLPVNSGAGCFADRFDFRLRGGNFIATKFLKTNVYAMKDMIHSFVSDLNLASGLYDDFLSFFRDLDLSHADPLAMQYHYINMRSRFHYGKNWLPRGKRILTPLIDRALADLFLRKGSTYRRFYCDLLLAIDKGLALIPFDHPNKAISHDLLMQSPFFAKSVKLDSTRIPDISIYSGAQQDTKCGEYSDQSFREMFVQKYREFEEAGMETKLFSEACRDAARREIASGIDLGRDFRRAAHILSAGMLLSALSETGAQKSPTMFEAVHGHRS